METDHKKLCTILYAAFALTAVMQFNFYTAVLGSFALLGALVAVYNGRKKAPEDTLYQSHYTWLIRTFWIGTGVYMPVFSIAAAAVLLSSIDFSAIMEKMSEGSIADPMAMQSFLLETYGALFRTVTICTALPLVAWWFWRCGKGYGALKNGQPVSSVMSWL